jgi:hypothetical protein
MEQWKCHDLGECKEFLHMRIICKVGKICLDRTIYLQKVLTCFGIANSHFTATPLPQAYKPLENTNPPDSSVHSKFQSVIGSLLYIMLDTWPDIAYAITRLSESQFTVNPLHEHLDDSDWAADSIKQ